MKKETEGYFVIKYKNKDKYITDSCCYTRLIEDAWPFKTFSEAYEYMEKYSLDKDCIIEEVK